MWSKDENEQIKNMLLLWNSFKEDEKPEWLTKEDILKYEFEMNKTYRTNIFRPFFFR